MDAAYCAPGSSSKSRRFVVCSLLGLALLTAILYGRTLSYPFVFDDWVYLVDNPLIKEVPTFNFWLEPREFAAKPTKMELDMDLSANIMLRPVSYFSFYLNGVSGTLQPAGFRLVNIIIHGANSCLVFLILRHILLRSRLAGARERGAAKFIPLASALVFVAHPMQIESVTYIVQRFTSMAGFFYLLTIWLHLVAVQAKPGALRGILRTASVLSVVLGMLSKEIVFMAPALLVLIDWLLMGESLKPVLRRAAPLLCCMAIVPALVLFVAWAQNGGELTLHGVINVSNDRALPPSHVPYCLNELRVILTYLWLVLVPAGLNVDPDVRPLETFLDWRIVLGGLGIVCIVAAAWAVYRRKNSGLRGAMIFTFTIWFFADIAISSAIVPLPDLMAEHRAYLPSLGAIIVLVCLLDIARTRLPSHGGWRHAVPSVAALWVAILCVTTLARNEVWASRRSLWEDAVSKSPEKARPLANLGACDGDEGRLERAEDCFRRALAIDARHPASNENLATILVAKRQNKEALEFCKHSLSLGVDSCKIRHNLGVALCNTGRIEEGIASLKAALERRPDFRPTHFALGQVYSHLQKYEKALASFRRAAALGPPAPELQKAIHLVEKKMATFADSAAAR